MDKFIIKSRHFSRWATDAGVENDDLCVAIDEMERGLVDARLGADVYKMRIALQGRGKRSGARTIIATNFEHSEGNRWIFLYGFAKNEKENLSKAELTEIKNFAHILLTMSNEHFLQLTNKREWEKISCKKLQKVNC